MQTKYGYLSRMLGMLTSAYTHRDEQNIKYGRALETNVGKLFSLLAEGLELVRECAETVREWDNIEKAEGAVLDRYGANYGVARGNASDALYRIFIQVKMLAQLSGGDWDTVIQSAGELLGVEYSEIDSEDVYPAKIALYVDESLLSDERRELIDQIAEAIKRILTGGVGLRLYLRTYRTYTMKLPISYGAFISAHGTPDFISGYRKSSMKRPASYSAYYHVRLTPQRID